MQQTRLRKLLDGAYQGNNVLQSQLNIATSEKRKLELAHSRMANQLAAAQEHRVQLNSLLNLLGANDLQQGESMIQKLQ